MSYRYAKALQEMMEIDKRSYVGMTVGSSMKLSVS